jgi:hypothetical protein
MTNQEALDLLSEFTETTSSAVQIAVWAGAFLQEGGEPTWDAVKSVSDIASTLMAQSAKIANLREIYDEITP